MNSAYKGVLLGLANVLVISIAIASGERNASVAMLVTAYGLVPGLAVGAVLGMVAQGLGARPVPLRIAVLTLPAIGLVYWLAHEFGMQDLWLISCIPTVVAALILERWTRVHEPPPVPVARVAE